MDYQTLDEVLRELRANANDTKNSAEFRRKCFEAALALEDVMKHC